MLLNTQVGSTILVFNVVSLCEIQESLDNILKPNSFFKHRNIFYVYSIYCCQIFVKISAYYQDIPRPAGCGIRDWSLITGRGGGYKTGGGGGHVKFYPYEKGGRKKF